VAPRERPPLSVAYAAAVRVGLPEAPLRQLVAPSDVQALLAVDSWLERYFSAVLATLVRDGPVSSSLFGAPGSAVSAAESAWRWVVRILLVWALVHVPFRRRPVVDLPAPSRAGRIAALADLVFPGAGALLSGRVVRGALLLAALPLLATFAVTARHGGIMTHIVELASELTLAFDPDAGKDVLRSDLMRALGWLALGTLGTIYLVTWIRVAREWLSSRRSAPEKSSEVGVRA
jgi:hypothetical protein